MLCEISAWGRFQHRADFSIGQISHSGRFQHRADFTLGQISASECYKTVLILETRFCEAGAAESLEIGKIEVGSSNRSGRLCKVYGTAYQHRTDFTLGQISASTRFHSQGRF